MADTGIADTATILSALGGAAVFLAGVWAVVRGVVRQTIATRENTRATERLSGQLSKLAAVVDDNTARIGRLEGRPRRGER